MKNLLVKIKNCRECDKHLELGANPVVTASKKSKILIIGQAPGRIVHNTSIPWNDKSGDNLRNWLDVDKSTFYNTDNFAIMPMGFCFPGKDKNGDLPPRTECAPLWHSKLINKMPEVKLTLLIGQYSQKYYLGNELNSNLTETVRHYHKYLPNYFPLPHPSPRNNIWLKKNEWFLNEVLPELRKLVRRYIH